MAVERITVRKKTNPAITRTIRASALNTFSKRGWEAVPGQAIPEATVEVKKKDVEPAEAPVSDLEKVSEEPFLQIGDGDKSLDDLRTEYKTLSGKDADKRWKAERLTDEISKYGN